jgi:hypothetical protein
MAMGGGVRVASASIATQYGYANGTSFSCPLSAGIAALILSANPSLGPLQVRDAMRNTADNAATPNNFDGWGVLDADSAVGYWGIVPMAHLSGVVFHDLNGNGVQDGGEPGLGARTVVLAGPAADSVVTGGGGAFQFGGLPVGSYTLAPSPVPGWIVTTPPESLGVTLLHRDTASGFSLGLFQAGALSGKVFNDTNANGAEDPGESGLAGWTVRLTGPVVDSTITGGGGEWSFTGLPAGAYTVSQDQQDNWLQSLPASYGNHSVTVTNGLDTAGLDFGNYFHAAGVYPVTAGWNLLSLPVTMNAPIADSVYPNAVTPVSIYENGYSTVDTIPNGRGYWVKFPSPQNILLDGFDRTLDTVWVVNGWNLIGCLSVPVPVASIQAGGGTTIVSSFFGYGPAGYFVVPPDGFLLPHTGYWVKCSGAGYLILEGAPAGQEDGDTWVAKFYQGGAQCDAEVYRPPDTRGLLEGAGIAVLDVAEEEYAVCAACGCPDYAGVRYALINESDIGKAGGMGFQPSDPPSAGGGN